MDLLFGLSDPYIWGMGEENGSDEEDKDAGHALEAFFGQFGQLDTYSSIVLEEFFRELMDGEK
jgi:hypothetical protein